MFSIKEILPDLQPITIVDIGAMAIEGSPAEYQTLIDSGLAIVIGFEPVESECAKLNASTHGQHKYLPYFIGNGEEGTFHLCNFSMTSSLYEPNTPLLEKFQNLAELVQVVETSKVATIRIDDIPEITDADLIKIDIQGAELDAFSGARRLLEKAVAVHTEVEFVPLYKNQPLFAEIDKELRKSGFVFHKFFSLSGRAFKPLYNANNPNAPLSQLLWADAIYYKDFMNLESLSKQKLISLCVIAHELYQSYDFCAHALLVLDNKTGNTNYQKEYISRLTSL